uniref:Lipoprotein n=1 Tax=Caenorhabditis japonica TaxID=281687 RepID=A0A8R1DSU2_CAEJA
MLQFVNLFVACLVLGVFGCAPGTGTLGNKGTFEFEMIPPISYTYSDDPSNGQISMDYANSRLRSDVKNSIDEVLQANSIPLNDVSPPVITYTPPVADLVDGTSCTVADTTLIYDYKAFYFCHESTNEDGTKTLKKREFIVPLKVQITSVQAIYESQWNALANQVQDKLTIKRNAAFLNDPIITVQ